MVVAHYGSTDEMLDCVPSNKPQGGPPAEPCDELDKKGKKIPAKVKSIRGKLNVPRERFHLTSEGRYRWAGND